MYLQLESSIYECYDREIVEDQSVSVIKPLKFNFRSASSLARQPYKENKLG